MQLQWSGKSHPDYHFTANVKLIRRRTSIPMRPMRMRRNPKRRKMMMHRQHRQQQSMVVVDVLSSRPSLHLLGLTRAHHTLPALQSTLALRWRVVSSGLAT